MPIEKKCMKGQRYCNLKTAKFQLSKPQLNFSSEGKIPRTRPWKRFARYLVQYKCVHACAKILNLRRVPFELFKNRMVCVYCLFSHWISFCIDLASLSLSLSLSLCVSVCLSVCLSLSLSLCLSVCLSVSLSLSLSNSGSIWGHCGCTDYSFLWRCSFLWKLKPNVCRR